MNKQYNSVKLPKGWITSRLGDVCYVQGGFAFKSGDYQVKGIPLVRISNIENNRVNLNTDVVYLKTAFKKEASGFLLKRDDILIALSGATTGKYGIFDSNKDALLNQRVGRIRLYSDDIPNKYLFYYLGIIRQNILRQAYGAAQPNISTTELSEFPLPLSPFNEQKRIVAKIEELFTKLDAGVEALKKVRAELKRYRQAVLKYAFEGKLTAEWRKKNKNKIEPASKLLERIAKERGKARANAKKLPPLDKSELPELPKGWKWARLGYIIQEPKYGTSKKCTYEKQGIGVLRIPNICNGVVDVADLKYAKFDKDERNTYQLLKGDLLTIRSNGSVSIVGKCAMISEAEERYLFAGYLIRLRLIDSSFNSKYLLYAMNSNFMRNQIESKAKSTSGVNNINSDELKSLVLPICSSIEQNYIVSEIERHFSIADKVERVIENSLKEAERLRQSILKKAFEGKLVPQDANDEPAEKLLERINKEKNKTTNNSKKERKVSQRR